MATKIAKVLFLVAGVLFGVAAIVPELRGGEVQTSRLSIAVVFLILALAVRPRRTPTPPGGPGA